MAIDLPTIEPSLAAEDVPGERARREQREVLGVDLPRSDRPLTVLGLTSWRALWSMGRGAGTSAFMRSPAALAAAGHQVHLVMPCAAGDEGRSLYAGVHFHRYRAPDAHSDPRRILPWRLTSRIWRFAYHQPSAARQAVRVAHGLGPENAPDLVVAFGVMSVPAARRVADRLGIPLVARCFGNNLSTGLHKRLRWYGNFIERVGFRVPVNAMILTNDGSAILEALDRLEVDLTPIHFLRNGIAGDRFSPGPKPRDLQQRLGLDPSSFVLLTATRLHREKRLERTIRALAELRRIVPQAVAVLLGDGPERESLAALAQRLGVADAVHFPGPVRNAALPPWYRLADVVLSLLDRTNASNPVFEAMACERCVLALDVGTTAEVIRDGETGILLPPAQQEMLVGLLVDLARDAERRTAIGRRARGAVLELCGTVEDRMIREIEIVEAAARGGVVRGNLCRGADPA